MQDQTLQQTLTDKDRARAHAYVRQTLHYLKCTDSLLKERLRWFLQEYQEVAPQVVERAKSVQITAYSFNAFSQPFELHTKVKSSDGKRYYSVRIAYYPISQELVFSCTCPAHQRGICKHAVALAQAFVRSSQ